MWKTYPTYLIIECTIGQNDCSQDWRLIGTLGGVCLEYDPNIGPKATVFFKKYAIPMMTQNFLSYKRYDFLCKCFFPILQLKFQHKSTNKKTPKYKKPPT